MTAILRVTTTANTSPVLRQKGAGQNDDIIDPPWYRTTKPQTREGIDIYSDILWTRSSFPGQINAGGNGFTGLDSAHQQWEWNFPPTGSHTRKNVSGTVVDSVGNAVSGATVKLFNTATGLLVDTQTSASDGSFTCTDPNGVTCFAVAYLAGSPDTEGTTVNTLTGT